MRAKAAIEATFGLVGAPAIVESVVKGFRLREGTCLNGDEYFVHGIGYTVVLPDGGQVHIDGSNNGDMFSTYDVIFLLETSGSRIVPTISSVEEELNGLVDSGELERIAKNKYLVPQRVDEVDH